MTTGVMEPVVAKKPACAAIFSYATGRCVGIIEKGSSRSIDPDAHLLIAPLRDGDAVQVNGQQPARQIRLTGPMCGDYRGYAIPEWLLMADGTFYHYVGTTDEPLDIETVKSGQILLTPGLLYHNDTSATIAL